MNYHLNTPLTKEDARKLKAGDIVTISGIIYTARDAAHKRMLEEYDRTGTLPFDIKNQIIYYAGPFSGKARRGDWCSRPNNFKPDGCLCTTAVGYGGDRDDRKRQQEMQMLLKR